MGSVRIALLAASLVAFAAGMPAAHAQGVSVCTFSTHVSISPGTSTTPSSGTFTTGGETGTIDCQGSITGAGTIGYDGTFGDLLGSDTCAFGEGSGTLSYTINATTITGDFHYVRAAVAGTFGGPTSGGGSIAGVFQFAPDAGQDCVNTAVTGATVTGAAVLVY